MPENTLSYLLVVITLAIFVLQAQADTNQEQIPAGDTVFLNEDRTKITYRITSNDSSVRDLVLNVVIGRIRVHRERHQGQYTLTYNSCTDSDRPTWQCMEAQITLWGREHKFETISFSLYDRFVKVKTLSTVQLQPHQPSTTDADADADPNDDQTPTRLATSIVVITGSNKGPLELSTPASMGLIVAVAVCVLIIVALIATLVMVVVCVKKTKKDSTPKDPERQAESHPHITTGEQPTSD